LNRASRTNAGVHDQDSDVGIGYRDEVLRVVIGILWDVPAARAFMRFL